MEDLLLQKHWVEVKQVVGCLLVLALYDFLVQIKITSISCIQQKINI